MILLQYTYRFQKTAATIDMPAAIRRGMPIPGRNAIHVNPATHSLQRMVTFRTRLQCNNELSVCACISN